MAQMELRTREVIASRLRGIIASEGLRPGMRLPSEVKLASALGTSRPTLREGMMALEIAGEIEIRSGSGAYVCHGTPKMSIEMEAKPGPMEFLNARITLESAVAAEAAKRGSEETFREMGEIVEQMCETVDIHAYRQLNRKYHLLIAVAAGQQLMSDLIDGLIAQWERGLIAGNIEVDRAEDEYAHRRILSALTERDPIAASAAMREHLQRNRERVIEERVAA